MAFGVLLLGPPGCGKSTLCAALLRSARAQGRAAIAVNLDPANDAPGYECAIDVSSLIASSDASDAFGLGPNGALLYSMEFLARNADWLAEQLAPHVDAGAFVVIDCPGQAELYTSHEEGLPRLLRVLGASSGVGLRLAALHLLDAHHAADPAKFIAGSLLALQGMVRLELPHINVLSKADQTQHFEGTAYGIETFTDFLDIRSILPFEDVDDDGEDAAAAAGDVAHGQEAASSAVARAATLVERTPGGGLAAPSAALRRVAPRTAKFLAKFRRLNEALAEVIEDYNLISFTAVSAADEASVAALLAKADHAMGFVRTTATANAPSR